MECNRDDANRAKEIAEEKFSAKDLAGAKKFALKAKGLFPGLDGISQLLAILDVYDSAESKINGELDYYGILGVNPLSDDDTVRKHYRKLALSLHPDKNKSVGAEGAFHFVSEAWNLLSDKDKRTAYDSRRNGRVFKTQNGVKNGFHNFTKTTAARTYVATTKAKVTNTKTKTKETIKVNSPKDDIHVTVNTGLMGPTSVPSSSDNKQIAPNKTFWTVCKRCKLQYEFGRMYLNRNLLCPTCHGPFHATETPPPNFNNAELANGSSSQWGPLPKPTSPGPSPADVAQAETMVKQTYTGVKRDREESKAAKKEEALRKKISKKEAELLSKQIKSVKTKKDVVNRFDENKEIGSSNCSTQVEVKKVGSNSGDKNRLIKKATTEIKKKLNEWNSETVKDSLENGDSENQEIKPLVIDVPDSDSNGPYPDCDVPDPDFHDFDCERSEKCFKEGQVWAAYDDRDGMPRSFAIIHKVISLEPFKMKLCWLNSKPEKAFGEFKPGKHKIVTVPNYFSHKPHFTKLENGNVFVYPKKGDVCALFTDLVNHKYEIVEVDEYDKETGTTVTPLVKVAGFKTVFHRHLDISETRVILEKEMFRFSHQIPSYLLTGQESANAPKGCRELDPAALAPEFVQVTENGENVDEAEKMVDEDCVLVDVKVADNMKDDEECSKY